ncbi:MAG: ATP-binding cassette domain-containing protein [Rikenellaceae bacterium]
MKNIITQITRNIPVSLRYGAVRNVVYSLLCSIIDLVSVIAFVPLMAAVVDPNNIFTNQYLYRAYLWSGCGDTLRFTLLLTVLVLAIIIVKSAVIMWLSYMQKVFMMRFFTFLTTNTFKNYYRKGLLFIKTHNSNKLINEIWYSSFVFAISVVGSAFTIISDSLLLLIICSIILVYKPLVFLILVIVFVPMVLLYGRVIKRRMRRYGTQENDLRIGQYRILVEAVRGFCDIKISGSFDGILKRYDQILKDISHKRIISSTIGELPSKIVEISVLVGIIGLLLLTIYMGDNNADSLLFILGVFVIFSYKVMPAINRIIGSWVTIQRNNFSLKIFDNINGSSLEDVESENVISYKNFQHIKVDEVTFFFEEGKKKIFENYTLEINRGDRLLISGQSGCGKTTLLRLLMGFYTPQSGSVTIDGKPMSDGWQREIGYVSQEIFIMDDTLLANITMESDKEKVDFEKLEKVISWVSLDEIGVELDEELKEFGNRLSGGQKQRIGIARALYKGADILFMDEATSSLDLEAETQIYNIIKNLPQDTTIVLISHHVTANKEIIDTIFTKVEEL